MKTIDLSKLSSMDLRKKLSKMQAYDITELFMQASETDQVKILSLLSDSKLSDVFIKLPIELKEKYYGLLTKEQSKRLLNSFEMDELKVFILDFDQEDRIKILSFLSEERRKLIEKLLAYDETYAISLMTTEWIKVFDDEYAYEATKRLIDEVKDNDYIDVVFVVNREEEYLGYVELATLITARKHERIVDLIEQKQMIGETETINQALRKIKDYDLKVLPVITIDKTLIGIVTADDLFSVMIDQYEEDIEKMVSVGDYDVKSSIFERVRLRTPWLLASVVLNLVIASILSYFEATLVEVIALVLFQPMILGMAGNIGTQAIAVTILGLHHSKLESKEKLRSHIIREIGIGLINSLFVAMMGFLVVYVTVLLMNIGNQSPFEIAIVIAISLFGGMFISAIAGLFIPIVLNKLHIDPAAASGPIISTVNDLFALLIYFSVATLLLVL